MKSERLAVVEPEITPKVVRGTLAYLKRQGTVENYIRGRWELVDGN